MTDASLPPHSPSGPDSIPGGAHEIEVDIAGFLPDGVILAGQATDTAEMAEPGGPAAAPVDTEALSQVERDLDAVDAAIAALDAGTYGIDPATGEPIADALLVEDPTRLS